MNVNKIHVDLVLIVLIYLVHIVVNVQVNIYHEDLLKLDVKEPLLTWLVHVILTVQLMLTVLPVHVDVELDTK